MKYFFNLFLYFLSFLFISSSIAQKKDWGLDASLPKLTKIPEWIDADSLRDALEYDSTNEIRGLIVDLNEDGTNDYIFECSLNVCGSNCQYYIIDGKTHRSLGLVVGSVIYFRKQFINGYPVINQYGHSSAESGYWSTVVYDGNKYVAVNDIWVTGETADSLFRELKNISFIPPTASN